VQNYCRNRLSKIIRKRQGSEAYEEFSKESEDGRENKEVSNNLSADVQDAIDKLKEGEREVLVMKFMSGLTIQEMAEVLGVGLSAAKMRLYRAMESFKAVYTKQQAKG